MFSIRLIIARDIEFFFFFFFFFFRNSNCFEYKIFWKVCCVSVFLRFYLNLIKYMWAGELQALSFVSFLWIGIILAIFKELRKTPVIKVKLNISSRCWDILFWVSLSFLSGILIELVDLLLFREEIIASISALHLGVMEKEP